MTNCPFLSSNSPSWSAYGVFISQLIRYARDCSSFECFILRAARLSCKLFGQGCVRERLKSSLRKLYSQYGISSNIMKSPSPKCYMTFLDMIIYSDTLYWWDISLNRDLVTELDLITIFDVITSFWEVSMGHLQRMRLANRGRLLLRTSGPVPFGTWICSNVETILFWTCHVYGPCFNHLLHKHSSPETSKTVSQLSYELHILITVKYYVSGGSKVRKAILG